MSGGSTSKKRKLNTEDCELNSNTYKKINNQNDKIINDNQLNHQIKNKNININSSIDGTLKVKSSINRPFMNNEQIKLNRPIKNLNQNLISTTNSTTNQKSIQITRQSMKTNSKINKDNSLKDKIIKNKIDCSIEINENSIENNLKENFQTKICSNESKSIKKNQKQKIQELTDNLIKNLNNQSLKIDAANAKKLGKTSQNSKSSKREKPKNKQTSQTNSKSSNIINDNQHIDEINLEEDLENIAANDDAQNNTKSDFDHDSRSDNQTPSQNSQFDESQNTNEDIDDESNLSTDPIHQSTNTKTLQSSSVHRRKRKFKPFLPRRYQKLKEYHNYNHLGTFACSNMGMDDLNYLFKDSTINIEDDLLVCEQKIIELNEIIDIINDSTLNYMDYLEFKEFNENLMNNDSSISNHQISNQEDNVYSQSFDDIEELDHD